jgi:hypothetical protein
LIIHTEVADFVFVFAVAVDNDLIAGTVVASAGHDIATTATYV